ncbi:MAG: DUF5606 domain-containing protein [Paludibacteraceae bacterium]|nr:DUF5606 domain-containing protein [Paludibacteraceae bacterium]
MLKEILAVTGKPGLFRLVSRGNNMLIIESLEDGKRMPTYARDKIVSLADISMFTMSDDKPLNEVLISLKEKQNGEPVSFDIKKADNDTLRSFFAEVLPDFDRDRVYPSDIRKLLIWYNILIKAGITDFTIEEETESVAVADDKKEEKHAAPTNKQVRTQKSAATSVKTGVGAKRG